MTKILFAIPSFFLLLSLNAFAENSKLINSEAIKASENFLFLLDAEDYDTAWEESSTVLKIMKSKETWANELRILRELFGYQINRTPKKTNSFNTLSGLPDGKYHLLIMDTSFEKKKKGIQSIIVMHDKDGMWRVVDYIAR